MQERSMGSREEPYPRLHSSDHLSLIVVKNGMGTALAPTRYLRTLLYANIPVPSAVCSLVSPEQRSLEETRQPSEKTPVLISPYVAYSAPTINAVPIQAVLVPIGTIQLKTDASTCFVGFGQHSFRLADARCYQYDAISKAQMAPSPSVQIGC
ncbi:hypothetical protein RB195_020895 [Necator americanus]|uniref:Peptidase A1 domain-containing protein n=1 Tax=Necator americanus TaxID=51031 RepID=A0ABR1CL32_NECAM